METKRTPGTADRPARLANAASFDEVFEIVKATVEKTLEMHRAGLTLVLAELPNYIGAYHVVGSNLIVMNKTILDLVKTRAKSTEELNAFVYTILMHEYLHSLGVYDEGRVRRLVRRVAADNFGPDHVATQLSSGNLSELYPELRLLGGGRVGDDFEIIRDFDRSSFPYIG
jgi:hypothetical protein